MDDPVRKVDPVLATELLRRRFRVPVWYGLATRRWWALWGDRFVEAGTPEELGRLLDTDAAVTAHERLRARFGGSGQPGL